MVGAAPMIAVFTSVPVALQPVVVEPLLAGVGLVATTAAIAVPGFEMIPPPPRTCPAPLVAVADCDVPADRAGKVCVAPT